MVVDALILIGILRCEGSCAWKKWHRLQVMRINNANPWQVQTLAGHMSSRAASGQEKQPACGDLDY